MFSFFPDGLSSRCPKQFISMNITSNLWLYSSLNSEAFCDINFAISANTVWSVRFSVDVCMKARSRIMGRSRKTITKLGLQKYTEGKSAVLPVEIISLSGTARIQRWH